MKHKLLIAAATSALMAAPSFAAAEDNAGWYLKGAGGYGTHTDIDITGDVMGDVESEGNIALNLAAGYDFGDNWRLEVDGASLFTDLASIAQQPSSFAKLRTDTLMLNALYDFSDFGNFAPYIGAGVGLVRGDVSIAAHDFLDPTGQGLIRNPVCTPGVRPGTPGLAASEPHSCNISDKDTGFGYQLIAGLGYDISDNLTWDTSYRYMDAPKFDVRGLRTNTITDGSDGIGASLVDAGAHTLLTGFRYRFGGSAPKPVMVEAPRADFRCWDGSMVFNAGQCPAEPMPEPAPVVVQPDPLVTCWDGSQAASQESCPAQPPLVTCWDGTFTYDQASCPVQISDRGNDIGALCGEQYRQEIIYYEFNKGQSAETRNTINRILDTSSNCNVEAIRVVGHTDTSGNAAYNLNLSKRRAQDALNELVRQGVDRRTITSEGKGETEPFIDTGDGVKEQLNRRTEVLITLGSIGAMMQN